MRFARSRHPERLLNVDLASMVDVVFLLIIFFMTAAQFARITRADVELPREEGEKETQPDEAGLVINILATGEIIVGSESVELEGLRAVIQREIRTNYSNQPAAMKLMIRADRSCDSARLNQIVELLRELDVAATRVATEVPRGSR